jgi:hypothetical protein
MKKEKTKYAMIGRLELADFPVFGLEDVVVKVDTGAYTSSIHVATCEERITSSGKVLVVVFLDESHPQFTGEERMFTSYRQKKVKSSTGQEQLRYFVNGSIRLGDLEYTTEFSLTRRNGMRHPILLGRKLLNRRFVVDPSRKNITRKSSK